MKAFAKLFSDLETIGHLQEKITNIRYRPLENFVVYENNDINKFIIDYSSHLAYSPARGLLEENFT